MIAIRFARMLFTCAALGVPTTMCAQIAVTTLDSPAGRLLTQWLDRFNAEDSAGLEAFAAAHCPTCKAPMWLGRHREFGSLGQVSVVSEDSSGIIFAARSRSAAVSVRGNIQLADGDPSRIKRFALLATSPGPTFANCATRAAPSTHGVSPADVASEDAIVAALYDVISGPACQDRDWDRFRGLFAPGGQLIPKEELDPARFGIHAETPEEFADLAGPSMEHLGFFEKEVWHTGESFNGVVHRFSTYESRRAAGDAAPFARGINSIQMLYDGRRWWLVTVYWAAEQPGVPIPDRYLNHQ
ncbi:MAG TPA: hypothetical protein VGM20_02085 [Gemmatimonadales bacterium]